MRLAGSKEGEGVLGVRGQTHHCPGSSAYTLHTFPLLRFPPVLPAPTHLHLPLGPPSPLPAATWTGWGRRSTLWL